MTLRFDRFHTRLAAVGLLLAAIGLAGCGRKGSLELPPTAAADSAVAAEVGEDGKPLAPKGQNKRIPLDRLLD